MSAHPIADKPFHLIGNFAPVEREVTATDLPVEGALPPELTGLYVRQTPNPVTAPAATRTCVGSRWSRASSSTH